ncbi:hypothetical protein BKI52_24880 [marine bacterium AO1-C]|nr:hypothetical protein BKI52_24880 [marine bacterium AO1-C]
MTDQIKDKIRGVIFGQAIGDAIGLGTEFMTQAMVKHYYPDGLTEYTQILQDKHRKRWKPGEWTDDTNQMLCILDSILATKRVDVKDIALTLVDWAHHDGRGLGRTVYSVLGSPIFMQSPHEAAKNYWEKSNRYAAANGAVMRTSVLGIWEYNKPEKIRINATKVCKITHYDPRCVGSCVMVCLVISHLLQGKTDLELVSKLLTEGDIFDQRIRPFLQEHVRPNIAALNLSDQESIGYTLKALGAGLWALQYAISFESGISTIIHEGGDADTNASVAGAILGARFGYEALPIHWKDNLHRKDWLMEQTNQLIALMEAA